MAKGRFGQWLAALSVAKDGGARLRRAEHSAERARLSFRDGRAVPRHIAIIMDGNGRWATGRHLPRAVGHTAGVEALRRVVRLSNDYHVPMVTVYAFSTENWGRPQEEVDALMRLMWETIRSDVDRLHREGVRLRHIGRLDGLAQDIQDAILWMEDLTKDNDKLELNVAFNYGGRAEIVDAVRAIVAEGTRPEQVTEELIERHLYTSGLPDPDLVIRTAGEMRLSNYLIWQVAYAEYYSTPTLWPDFGRDDFEAALDAYAQRKRRFGKTDAQLASETAAQASPPAEADEEHGSGSGSGTNATRPLPVAEGVR